MMNDLSPAHRAALSEWSVAGGRGVNGGNDFMRRSADCLHSPLSVLIASSGAASAAHLFFGPAGHEEAYAGKSADYPAYLHDLGLDALEVQCGHGVRVTPQSAEPLRQNAEKYNISLSVHTPYFINLANPERTEANIDYLRKAAAAADLLGAERLIVHTGALMKQTRETALGYAAETVRAILAAADDEGWGDKCICLETMGKIGQLGDLSEVLTLCKLNDRLLPCVDFGHLYARSLGVLDGADAFGSMLDQIEAALGLDRARRMHMHFSKIEFTAGGEKQHRTFADNGGFGPDWDALAALLAARKYNGTVICESRGTQAADAAAMKAIYGGLI